MFLINSKLVRAYEMKDKISCIAHASTSMTALAGWSRRVGCGIENIASCGVGGLVHGVG